jgi:hypothetical protein
MTQITHQKLTETCILVFLSVGYRQSERKRTLVYHGDRTIEELLGGD